MEEVEFVEDGEAFSCAHCKMALGTWTEIIENSTIQEHICFTNSSNVQINFQSKHIYRLQSDNCEKVHISSSNHTPYMSGKDLPLSSSNNSQTNRSDDHWTDSMVQLLINSYNSHKSKFDSPLYNKKKVFEIISNDLTKHGYNKSGIKCDEKWRNLKKTYDKVRNENAKTGYSKTSWKYFDDFQDIYWHDPHFNPSKTVSSTGKVSNKADVISISCTQNCNSDENNKEKSGENIASISKKRKVMEDSSSVTSNDEEKGDTENRTKKAAPKKNLSPGEKVRCYRTISAFEAEQRKQKRHDEKMQLKREMFDWFKQNLKK